MRFLLDHDVPNRLVELLRRDAKEQVFHAGVATNPATGLTTDLAAVFS